MLSNVFGVNDVADVNEEALLTAFKPYDETGCVCVFVCMCV